jgi:hypothetical protein
MVPDPAQKLIDVRFAKPHRPRTFQVLMYAQFDTTEMNVYASVVDPPDFRLGAHSGGDDSPAAPCQTGRRLQLSSDSVVEEQDCPSNTPRPWPRYPDRLGSKAHRPPNVQ